MGSLYKFGINPYQDLLMQIIEKDGDISREEFKNQIFDIVSEIIRSYLKNSGDIVLLDFDIVKTGIKFQVIGKNFISALWLSGLWVENPSNVNDANACILDGIKFTYDPKTYKLKYEIRNK